MEVPKLLPFLLSGVLQGTIISSQRTLGYFPAVPHWDNFNSFVVKGSKGLLKSSSTAG